MRRRLEEESLGGAIGIPMAENDGGAAAAPRSDPPPRPTLALPPRSSYESLFRGGGASDVSPGPMTLVSSFFADDPDSDCRSFSQLLAGAMSSPAAAPSRAPAGIPVWEDSRAPLERTDSGGGGLVRQNRPLSLLVAPSPFFTVQPGLSPAGFLDSPAGFFSPCSGNFGLSHQQALAQVTAQAAQAHSHVHIQAEYPSSLSPATEASMTQQTSSGINMALLHQMPLQTSDTKNTTFESAEDSHCDRRSQATAPIVDKLADGYNWRKYGQKQMKGSEYPRSYYKCTHPSCPVKKKVERSLDGHVTEIIYKGEHNHQQPSSNRRGKEGSTLPSGSNKFIGNLDFPANSKAVSQVGPGNFSRSSDTMAAPSISKRERESGHGTSEQLSGSSDGDEVGDAELGTDEGDDIEPDPKRRNVDTRVMESTSSHKTVTEPRIIVQTTSELDLLDDGYRWRKYGQKVVKGNPYPRSYYKCTNAGCNVRKHIERASTDPKAVITTYEGKHNHDIPAARNISHNTASAGAVGISIQPKVHNTIPNNQPALKRADFRNNVRRPVSVQLKEERA